MTRGFIFFWNKSENRPLIHIHQLYHMVIVVRVILILVEHEVQDTDGVGIVSF